jgi:hypothetical protein
MNASRSVLQKDTFVFAGPSPAFLWRKWQQKQQSDNKVVKDVGENQMSHIH